MRAEIKKGTGIEGLVSGSKAEEEHPIKTVGNTDFGPLLIAYEAFLDTEGYFSDSVKILRKREITDILTPEEINAFLLTTVKYQHHYNYCRKTGIFVSKLIQNSHRGGYDQFKLRTVEPTKIHHIAAGIRGPLTIHVNGDVGNWCGHGSKNITFNIQGDAGDNCGQEAKKMTCTIEGNTGTMLGYNARMSAFNLRGNTGWGCGNGSWRSIFTIHGNTDHDCGKRSNLSKYIIDGDTGGDLGTHSIYSTFTVHGNTGGCCGRNSFGSTFTINGKVGPHGWGENSLATFTIKDKDALQTLEESEIGNEVILLHPDGTMEAIQKPNIYHKVKAICDAMMAYYE